MVKSYHQHNGNLSQILGRNFPSEWDDCHNINACIERKEETGELLKAANDQGEKRASPREMIAEAVHTAASAIRFLKNMEEQNNE